MRNLFLLVLLPYLPPDLSYWSSSCFCFQVTPTLSPSLLSQPYINTRFSCLIVSFLVSCHTHTHTVWDLGSACEGKNVTFLNLGILLDIIISNFARCGGAHLCSWEAQEKAICELKTSLVCRRGPGHPGQQRHCLKNRKKMQPRNIYPVLLIHLLIDNEHLGWFYCLATINNMVISCIMTYLCSGTYTPECKYKGKVQLGHMIFLLLVLSRNFYTSHSVSISLYSIQQETKLAFPRHLVFGNEKTGSLQQSPLSTKWAFP